MAKDYTIRLKDGSIVLVTGTALKIGKGKNTCDVIGIRKVVGNHGDSWYYLDHIPSGTLIAGGFLYQFIARHIANEIILSIGDTLRDDADSVAKAIESSIEDFITYMVQPSIQKKLNEIKTTKEIGRAHV